MNELNDSEKDCIKMVSISELGTEVVAADGTFGTPPHCFSSTGQSHINCEYIHLDEALNITGFQERHLRNTMKAAGVARIGYKSFDRREFFQFWRFKSKIEDSPKLHGETSRIRQLRINRGWRRGYPNEERQIGST